MLRSGNARLGESGHIVYPTRWNGTDGELNCTLSRSCTDCRVTDPSIEIESSAVPDGNSAGVRK